MRASLIVVITLITFLIISCNTEPENNTTTETEQQTNEPQITETEVKIKGDSIVKIAFKTLSSRLKSAMQTGGPHKAIEVCSKDAMRLTDSLSQVLNIKIKRTSHKIRNPQNSPDEWEQKVINHYLKQIAENQELKPYVEQVNGKWRYAKPIIIKPQCLVCHGEPSGEIKDLLQKYYPQDQATGFKEGELRGIWSIEL